MPLVGYFVTRKMGLAKIYRYINLKFLASPVPDLWEEGLKFKIWA